MVITSINNEKVKYIYKLQQKKYRDQFHQFVVEGDHLIVEAIKSNLVCEIYILDGYNFDFSFDGNINFVTSDVMKKMSSQDSSCNMLAICNMPQNNKITKNVIMLDQLQDPGNIGTIIRSAAAFNYDLFIGENTCDIFNPKTIRSTEGMIFHINFVKGNISEFIKEHSNYSFFVADMNKGHSVSDLKDIKLHAIIVGNEGSGVSDEIKNNENVEFVHIKQSSICESLNVGVAASILMHEMGDLNE